MAVSERIIEAEAWVGLLNKLQERPTEDWAEDTFKVFNLINRYQPEKIFSKIIEGIPSTVIVDSTKRGPALGGTRIRLYQNFANFLRDGLKLASAMTNKAIWARLNLGGGKAVIWASVEEITENFLLAYGDFLNDINATGSSGVLFITGEDVGFSEEFTDIVARRTSHIAGKSKKAGGLGDPSPYTAKGLQKALKKIVEEGDIFSGGLANKEGGVQGAGKVALPWIEMLLRENVKVYFSEDDGNPAGEKRAEMAERLGAKRIPKDEIYRMKCHFFLPCAVGGVMNKYTIPVLSDQCRIVMGAANNILDTPEDGEELHRRRIFYGPDYVTNRYGLEWVSQESKGITDLLIAEQNLTDIETDIIRIRKLSRRKNLAPSEIADIISRRILEEKAQTIEEAFAQLENE